MNVLSVVTEAVHLTSGTDITETLTVLVAEHIWRCRMTREEAIEKIKRWKLEEVYDVTINAVNKYYDEHHAQILSWTPCSERLPEHTGFYLIQHSRECCADEMAVAFYSVEEHEIDPDDCWEFSSVGDVQEVIAWMPLPEPYTEDKQ